MRTSTRVLFALCAFFLVLALPRLASLGGTGATSDLGLARELGQGSLLAFAAAFAGGVLTSLTPCVYPLIPITVSLFGARQARSRAQAVVLSSLYVLGIAVTYSVLGASAALTGKAFGAALQNPVLILAVVVVFLAMSASMFGAFELSLPTSLAARLTRVGGASLAGALGMGLVAGLIAAPCTGPVLAAALAFVASRGSLPFGVGIMFVYALGIGLPFFLIGTFSFALPKSGPWMDSVKSIFGVALLALALVYLRDLVPGLRRFFWPSAFAALLSALAAAAGVLLGGLAGAFEGPLTARFSKGLGVALIALGASYAVGVGQAISARAEASGIAWMVNAEAEGLARARAEGKPVIIDFWGDWCAACKELDRVAWSDPRVQKEAEHFVAIKIDNSADKMADPRTGELVDAAMTKYGIVGQPTVVFIDARGRELPADDRVLGVVSADEMLGRLKEVDRTCTAPAVACLARW